MQIKPSAIHHPGKGFALRGARLETSKAVRTIQLARNFLSAAQALLGYGDGNWGGRFQTMPTFQNPILLLSARSLELTLKAFLEVMSEFRKSDWTHDLEYLARKCRGLGLSVDEDDFGGLNRGAGLRPYHAAYTALIMSEYLPPIDELAERWTKIVKEIAKFAEAKGAKADSDYIL